MNKSIRITSGKYKGHSVSTPGGKTHPMGERERLALFNMIFEYMPQALVLDAYAGSGALGIEALSRGAKGVTFVDNSLEAERCIVKNLKSLGYDVSLLDGDMAIRDEGKELWTSNDPNTVGVNVVRAKVSDFRSDYLFDVILADPPYDRFNLVEVSVLTQLLKNDGVFVLSHPGETPEIDGLFLRKSRKYAGATISIFVKENTPLAIS